MSVKAVLTDPTDKKAVEIESFWAGPRALNEDERALLVTSPIMSSSTFKSVSRSTAGTDIITTPTSNGSIILADLVVSTEKQNAGTVTVQWNDGSSTVQIFKAFCNDAPVNSAIAFSGRVQGWRDAWIECVTVGATDNTVFLSYAKVPKGLPYSEWDALR
jgi:hypothetical protein